MPWNKSETPELSPSEMRRPGFLQNGLAADSQLIEWVRRLFLTATFALLGVDVLLYLRSYPGTLWRNRFAGHWELHALGLAVVVFGCAALIMGAVNDLIEASHWHDHPKRTVFSTVVILGVIALIGVAAPILLAFPHWAG